jgi:uncharacterized protein
MNKNLETINQVYEAFGRGDIQTILDCLADNVAWEQWENNSSQQAGVPWMLGRQGKDGALEFFKIVSALEFKDFQVLSVMGNETQVAAEILLDADVPSTGGHIRDEEIHLWTFNEAGKVVRFRHYTDTAKHIQAAK